MTKRLGRTFASRSWIRARSRIMAYAFVAVCPAVFSQSFTPTGSLNTGRNGQRAIALDNGNVLIVGGYDLNENALASSELYDPAAGTFVLTGSLNVARRNFGITLLDNGTVLVTGGVDANFSPLASAEIYDPATGVFTPTGGLNTARANHTATLLNDGTVLIAGGFDNSGNSISSAELYSPQTALFAPTGSLNVARQLPTATALMDGTVLVAGGWANGGVLSSAEVYDPITASFRTTGNLIIGRVQNTATLLNGGNVLIAGGKSSTTNFLNSAELYNPATGGFTLTGNLITARGNHAATLLTNGTVLLEGGFTCDPSNCATSTLTMSSSAEVYDPIAASFSATGSLAVAREVHTATLLTNGTVLVAAGWSSTNFALTSAEIYQPATTTPQNLASIFLSPLNPSLFVGAAQELVAAGTFSDNSIQTLASVIWSSSDNTVAVVSNDSGSNSGITNDSTNSGVVYGVGPGTATITACAGSVCGSTTVTVLSSGSNHSFTLSGSPPSRTITLGQATTFSLLLAPTAGFSGVVTLTCGGVPQGAQCSISPSSLKPSNAVNASAVVTITTVTSPAISVFTTSVRNAFWAHNFVGLTAVFLPISVWLSILLPRRSRKTAGILLFAVLLGLCLLGCNARSIREPVGGIAPGSNYVITVTGSSGTVSHATQFLLVIK